MENLDLTYNLIALKIKRKTLDQIYFMSQVFQEHSHCYDNRNKKENESYKKLSIFAATPSLSGLEGGGGRVVATTPHNFFRGKNFRNFFFHR